MVIPMHEEIVGNSRTMLLLLLGAVGLVLLIACANVGNLLFTRALSRRKEIAIRFALGAPRGRVFQQLLTEAMLLAAVGGALGLLLAYGALMSASTLLAGQVPRADEISIDGRVLLFAIGLSMLTGALAGTLPGVRASQFDLNDAVKEGGRSDGAIGVGTRRLLIVCEVALLLVLLMGAGVMVQSLLALRHVDTGFDPNNVLTMRVRLVEARYPTAVQRSPFFEAALQRIRALPGVVAAGTIDDLPFADGSSQTLALEGYAPQRDPVAVQVRQISPGYLRAMGIPVLRGRDVLDSDADVLLVSQDAAKLYWGADDAIGRRATLPALSKTVLHQVVGIVGDVKQRNLIEARHAHGVFLHAQAVWQGNVCDPDDGAARRARTRPRLRRFARSIQSSRSWTPKRWCRCLTKTHTAALQRAAARHLCRRRAAARCRRNVQRGLVSSCAAAAARSGSEQRLAPPPIRRPSAGDRRGHVARARRHRGRHGRRARVGEGHGNARLWCERIRSADARRGWGHARGCCAHSQRGARVPCAYGSTQ